MEKKGGEKRLQSTLKALTGEGEKHGPQLKTQLPHTPNFTGQI